MCRDFFRRAGGGLHVVDDVVDLRSVVRDRRSSVTKHPMTLVEHGVDPIRRRGGPRHHTIDRARPSRPVLVAERAGHGLDVLRRLPGIVHDLRGIIDHLVGLGGVFGAQQRRDHPRTRDTVQLAVLRRARFGRAHRRDFEPDLRPDQRRRDHDLRVAIQDHLPVDVELDVDPLKGTAVVETRPHRLYLAHQHAAHPDFRPILEILDAA